MYWLATTLVAILLVYNPVNTLLSIVIHRELPHSLILMLLGLLAAMIYRWQADGLNSVRKVPLAVKLAVVLFAWSVLNVLYGYASLGQSVRGLNVDFGGIFLFLTVWLLKPDAVTARRLKQLMLGVLAFITAFAIPELVSVKKFGDWAGYTETHFVVNKIPQIRSITTGPNPFGTLLGFMSYLVVLVFSRGWIVNLSMVPIGLLAGLTYARSAWGGAAVVAGGFFFYSLLKRRRFVAWPLILGAAILVGASIGAIRYHEGITGVLLHGKSTEQHKEAAVTAAKNAADESWRDRILGYGLGMAGPVVLADPATSELTKQYKNLNSISESWYLQLSQEIGFVGLLIYLWLYYEVTRQLFRRHVLVGFVALGLAVNALTLHTWAADANLNLMFWTLAGLTLYAPLEAEARKKRAV